jgi:CHAD domain-containing protein
MTTDRTAIRRWLAVGGAANRPPWRARKARHRPIVAPLAVTLAASAAIGFGVALARAGERRIRPRRKVQARRLGLVPGELLAPGLRRMAVEQADMALEQLAAADHGDARRAVHEARKAIKRLRTIVRLLEGELGAQGSAREHDALRAAAAALAGARDAEVMLATLDRLVGLDRKRLSGRAGVVSLRLQLAQDRDEAERWVLAPDNRLRVSEELRLFRGRASGWQLASDAGVGAVEPGLRKIYRQGRQRFRRAAGKRGGRVRRMHQWRKRVKDLRYAAEVLQRRDPGAKHAGSSRARRRAKREMRWLRRLGKRTDRLGEVLGEEHDLAVLSEWIRLHGAAAGAGSGTRRLLRKMIARRRRKLCRRALGEGMKLYERKPRRFLRRAARAYRRASPSLSRR